MRYTIEKIKNIRNRVRAIRNMPVKTIREREAIDLELFKLFDDWDTREDFAMAKDEAINLDLLPEEYRDSFDYGLIISIIKRGVKK